MEELHQLVEEKTEEKALTSALNLEIRYKKFTCLLKVATNNDLFKQQGIDNKLRIIHLKQLLTDDTRPKCHASMADIEALYADESLTFINDQATDDANPLKESDWFLNGCWPPQRGEYIAVAVEKDLLIASVEDSSSVSAKVKFLKALKMKKFPPHTFWVNDSAGMVVDAKRESIFTLRPILKLVGTSQKSLKFQLNNLDLLKQFVESHLL